MRAAGRGASPLGRYEEEPDGSQEEDLEAENARLRHELQRFRRYRSSSVGRESVAHFRQHRTSAFGAMQGRAREQLREVSEENDVLVERLKAKEREIEDLRAEFAKLRHKADEEQRQHFQEAPDVKESPKDVRLFKRHAQDIMKRMQEEKEVDLAKADQARKLLKLQYDDSQARCAKGKAEIVRMERELAHAEAHGLKQQAQIEDLQRHCEELRGMLEEERSSVAQLAATVDRLEEELETERMKRGGDGETLDMLDTFASRRRPSVASSRGPEELPALAQGGGHEPEVSGRLEEHVAELQRECEQLRAQLAIARRSQALQAQQAQQAQQPELASDAEEFRQECQELRGRLGSAEAQLADAEREGALLRARLASAEEEAAREAAGGGAAELRPEAPAPKAVPGEECELLSLQRPVSLEGEGGRGSDAASEDPAPSPSAGGLALLDRDELARECERLRRQLAFAEEELARTWPSQPLEPPDSTNGPAALGLEPSQTASGPSGTAARPAEGRPSESVDVQDPRQWALRVAASAVWQEYERLRREVEEAKHEAEQHSGPSEAARTAESRAAEADAAAAPPAAEAAAAPAVAAGQGPDGVCRNCPTLQRRLEEAEEQTGRLRRDQEQLRQQLDDSLALEGEHRAAARQLRKQLEEACGTAPPVPVERHVAPPVQLAGAAHSAQPAEAPVAETAGGSAASSSAEAAVEAADARFLDEERAEMLRRNEELLDVAKSLQRQLDLAQVGGDPYVAGLVEELSRLRRECGSLQERLHAAKMAELEAQRKADGVPGLLCRIRALEKQILDAEKEIAEWKEMAKATSLSGLFGSFVCAAPCASRT